MVTGTNTITRLVVVDIYKLAFPWQFNKFILLDFILADGCCIERTDKLGLAMAFNQGTEGGRYW